MGGKFGCSLNVRLAIVNQCLLTDVSWLSLETLKLYACICVSMYAKCLNKVLYCMDNVHMCAKLLYEAVIFVSEIISENYERDNWMEVLAA